MTRRLTWSGPAAAVPHRRARRRSGRLPPAPSTPAAPRYPRRLPVPARTRSAPVPAAAGSRPPAPPRRPARPGGSPHTSRCPGRARGRLAARSCGSLLCLLQFPVDGGPRHPEQLRQLGRSLLAFPVELEQVCPLLAVEPGLLALELSALAGPGHALDRAEPDDVHLELGERGEDVEEHLAERVGRVVHAGTDLQAGSAADDEVCEGTPSGADRANRSSLGTIRVSPEYTAANAWSRPGRAGAAVSVSVIFSSYGGGARLR